MRGGIKRCAPRERIFFAMVHAELCAGVAALIEESGWEGGVAAADGMF